MTFHVEGCCGSGSKFYFRVYPLQNPHLRFFVMCDRWTRRSAKDALDQIEAHGLKRKNVRFIVR